MILRHSIIKYMTIFIASFASAACSTGTGTENDLPANSLAARESYARDLAVEVDNDTFVATADIPPSGESSYSGSILMYDAPKTGLLYGRSRINVKFSSDMVTGSFNDFVYAENISDDSLTLPTVSGSLTLANGTIDRTASSQDAQLVGDLSGTLTPSSEMFNIPAGTKIDVASDFKGGLKEDSMVGFTSGTMLPSSGTSVDVAGVIIAVED